MSAAVSDVGKDIRSVIRGLVVYGDDCFNRAGRGVGEFIELIWNFGDVEAVSYPVLQVNFSVGDDLNDLGEIGWEGIATGHDGEFPTVEMGGLGEGDILSGDADVDDAATDGGILVTLDHGASVSGSIDDDVAEASFGDFFNLGKV